LLDRKWRVLADLDLKRAEAVPEPLFDLLLDLLRTGTVERREKGQFHLAIDPQERMVLQHFDRRQQGRCRNFTCVEVSGDHRLCVQRILADRGRGVLPAEFPAAHARLAAGTWRDMSLAPADPAVGIAHLDYNRLELGEGAIREDIRLDQGKPYHPQREVLQLHCHSQRANAGQAIRSLPLIRLRSSFQSI